MMAMMEVDYKNGFLKTVQDELFSNSQSFPRKSLLLQYEIPSGNCFLSFS